MDIKEQYKQAAELGKAIKRLQSNPDYKTVIEDGYIKSLDAFVTLLPRCSANQKEEFLNKIYAIALFKEFISSSISLGSQAEYQLAHQDEWEVSEEGDIE